LEIIREMGLQTEVREKARQPYEPHRGIVADESLAGQELPRIIPNQNVGGDGRSPTGHRVLDQDGRQPTSNTRAEDRDATLRPRPERIAFKQDSNGVRAVVRNLDTAEEREVRAKYMVAADGCRSRVRKALGIDMHGYGVLSKSVTVYFEADCAPYLQGRD